MKRIVFAVLLGVAMFAAMQAALGDTAVAIGLGAGAAAAALAAGRARC
ncbi:hypothetical protein [Amphiplicatus metriothermophilus]|uniref:Uncharacterized protein n=1 Tax=Amphiplicatus metriothermophilus TaxID=1519374 RepID=A0A239PSM9_9PROT|nr:hypothetical protein [Amphiplicatus metriothermophilus]MBB5519220.1 small-conductance mechanosensitive channel [Amphiplicatus metriothermophilus]SNT73289.1 hypothetical protein SAMN06297382_1687 [Amphiplicatus metriothermophilus]